MYRQYSQQTSLDDERDERPKEKEDDDGIFLISLIYIVHYCIISYYNRDVPLVYNILDMAQYFEMFKEFMKTQLKNKNRDESTERNKRGRRELPERRNYDDTPYDRSPERSRSRNYTPYDRSSERPSSGYRDEQRKKYLFMGKLSEDLKEALRVNYINLLYICVFILISINKRFVLSVRYSGSLIEFQTRID